MPPESTTDEKVVAYHLYQKRRRDAMISLIAFVVVTTLCVVAVVLADIYRIKSNQKVDILNSKKFFYIEIGTGAFLSLSAFALFLSLGMMVEAYKRYKLLASRLGMRAKEDETYGYRRKRMYYRIET